MVWYGLLGSKLFNCFMFSKIYIHLKLFCCFAASFAVWQKAQTEYNFQKPSYVFFVFIFLPIKFWVTREAIKIHLRAFILCIMMYIISKMSRKAKINVLGYGRIVQRKVQVLQQNWWNCNLKQMWMRLFVKLNYRLVCPEQSTFCTSC